MRTLKGLTLQGGLVSALIMLSIAAVTLGARPAKAAPLAYVTNAESGTVSVIDTASNTVVATIPVRRGPEYVAITPMGNSLT